MKSIGDVSVDDIKSDVAYVKEKEKQAQIVVPVTKRRKKNVKRHRGHSWLLPSGDATVP
jgi:ribosomal protein L21